jgi:hypothetical protein
VSFAAITLRVASQRVFIIVISLLNQSGNFWIYPRKLEGMLRHRLPFGRVADIRMFVSVIFGSSL